MPIASNKVRGRSAAVARSGVFIPLFAALICVSSFWTIPLIPGLPIVLKNLVVVLAGVLLGTWRGAAASGLFLLAGALGLPVFANAGGIAAFLSPAGGYMAGYAVGAFIAGLIAGTPSITDKKPSFRYAVRLIAALFAGFAAILLCGSLWLMLLNSRTPEPQSALAVFWGGIIPFIPGDAVKFVLSIPLAFSLRPAAARYLNPRA